MKKPIVIVGMMGAGKSTVGRMLAKALKYKFIDTDKVIEKSQNKTISNIFNEYGEAYFRKIEHDTVLQFLDETDAVLSLGGGAFENEDTRKALKNKATVIYLKASPYVLFSRIKTSIQRPLLHKGFSVETLAFILKRREANYNKANIIIDTANKTRKEVVLKILSILK